ncbi:unnamed protein product [Amoebophrya sp. A25]|nr:unnamed protein product [Amoebophrya sp. A25]|eukprot:GSA25T00012793001.1
MSLQRLSRPVWAPLFRQSLFRLKSSTPSEILPSLWLIERLEELRRRPLESSTTTEVIDRTLKSCQKLKDVEEEIRKNAQNRTRVRNNPVVGGRDGRGRDDGSGIATSGTAIYAPITGGLFSIPMIFYHGIFILPTIYCARKTYLHWRAVQSRGAATEDEMEELEKERKELQQKKKQILVEWAQISESWTDTLRMELREPEDRGAGERMTEYNRPGEYQDGAKNKEDSFTTTPNGQVVSGSHQLPVGKVSDLKMQDKNNREQAPNHTCTANQQEATASTITQLNNVASSKI